jgi:hypothetical protein
MNVSEVQARLEDMAEVWAEAHNADEGVPDGTYQAQVSGFDFFEARSTEELFLKVEFTIRHHERWDGFPLEAVQSLSNAERIPFTKALLSRLGVDPDTPAGGLLEALEAVRGVPVEVAVKNNERNGRVFQNVYVNARLGDPLPPGGEIPADMDGLPSTGKGDDDLGF